MSDKIRIDLNLIGPEAEAAMRFVLAVLGAKAVASDDAERLDMLDELIGAELEDAHAKGDALTRLGYLANAAGEATLFGLRFGYQLGRTAALGEGEASADMLDVAAHLPFVAAVMDEAYARRREEHTDN